MEKILYVSRNTPHQCYIDALKEKFGPEVEIDYLTQPFPCPEDIVTRYNGGGYADIVVADLLALVYNMCSLGCHPLWPDSAEEKDHLEIDFIGPCGRGYHFLGFRRIRRFVLEFED